MSHLENVVCENDDVDPRVCRCNYEEDRKNQKILVGYGLSSRDRCVIHHNPYCSQQILVGSGSLAETSVLFTITPIPRNRRIYLEQVLLESCQSSHGRKVCSSHE